MKALVKFMSLDKKAEIIAPFVGMKDCNAEDDKLVVPGVIKIDYSENDIKCYCLGLDVADKIISSVCNIKMDSSNNEGVIEFPKTLQGITIETKTKNFEKVLELCSRGRVDYVNTNKKCLKANVPLAQWIDASIIVEKENSFITFYFKDYSITVSDGSAVQFCNRVKEHPLISSSWLNEYFEFDNDMKIKPEIKYMCLWKVLKSDSGYKKYSNFINEAKDEIKIEYEQGKRYRCNFNGGKVDFELLSMGDKYPKKIVIQINELNDIKILEMLKNNFNINSIEFISKINDINLSIPDLTYKLKFFKDDEFFIFTNIKDGFSAKYDIGNRVLNIKQDFSISKDINRDELINGMDLVKKWIDDVLIYSN